MGISKTVQTLIFVSLVRRADSVNLFVDFVARQELRFVTMAFMAYSNKDLVVDSAAKVDSSSAAISLVDRSFIAY